MRLWLALAAGLSLAAAGGGYRIGVNQEQAKQLRELQAARGQYDRTVAQLRQTAEELATARMATARALEDLDAASRADPNADRIGISLGGVRRLNSLLE